MLFFFLLLGGLATTVSQELCPFGCSCENSQVMCSGLSYIPGDLPQNSTHIFFHNMAITEIPANIFSHLTQTGYIEFVNITVEHIRPYAFVGLNNVAITFENAKIDVFGSLAISKIDLLSRLDFTSVLIGVWEKNAVSDIKELQTFTFSTSAITRLNAPLMSKIEHVGFLSLSFIEIPELPPYSFSDLNVVDLVYVTAANIGEIGTSAFWNIKYMDNLIFLQCRIDGINHDAFSHVDGIGLISFQEVNLGTIQRRAFADSDQLKNIGIIDSMVNLMESYAFSDLSNTSSIIISNSQFGIIESFAFSDVTTKIFHFTGNKIERLDCGTFEELLDSVYGDFQFANITVSCDYNICWTFHPQRTYFFQEIFKDVMCHPGQTRYPRLGGFSGTTNDLPSSCYKFNYTGEFICSGSMRANTYLPLSFLVLTAFVLLCSFQ